MPTVDDMDRCQINNELHYLNVEIDKLRAKQSTLIKMRDQLDRHNCNAQCQPNQQQSRGNLHKMIESANGLKSILAEGNGNDMKLCQCD